MHFSPKKLTTFLVAIVTFKPTLNIQMSKQRGKNLAVDRGPLVVGGPLPWSRQNGYSSPETTADDSILSIVSTLQSCYFIFHCSAAFWTWVPKSYVFALGHLNITVTVAACCQHGCFCII